MSRRGLQPSTDTDPVIPPCGADVPFEEQHPAQDNVAAVVIERTFDAPMELIWQMWTDPEHSAA